MLSETEQELSFIDSTRKITFVLIIEASIYLKKQYGPVR